MAYEGFKHAPGDRGFKVFIQQTGEIPGPDRITTYTGSWETNYPAGQREVMFSQSFDGDAASILFREKRQAPSISMPVALMDQLCTEWLMARASIADLNYQIDINVPYEFRDRVPMLKEVLAKPFKVAACRDQYDRPPLIRAHQNGAVEWLDKNFERNRRNLTMLIERILTWENI